MRRAPLCKTDFSFEKSDPKCLNLVLMAEDHAYENVNLHFSTADKCFKAMEHL